MNSSKRTHLGISYLDNRRLARALYAGAAQLISCGDYLNKINVFPVPDGDTGTNMAATARAIAKAVQQQAKLPLAELTRFIADTAIDESRGNSGAILAQFFEGFAEGIGDSTRIDFARFCNAFSTAVSAAEEALANPRRGTIITVMQTMSRELERQNEAGQCDFSTALEELQEPTRQALLQTTEQLAELREAHVVDAGAMGFVELFSGALQLIQTGEHSPLAETLDHLEHDQSEPDLPHMERPEHRFCTECMINGQGIDRLKLNQSISAFASSVVIAGGKMKVRVHAHVDNPDTLFQLCEQWGEVSHRKADDMVQQQQSAHTQRGALAVITDSGADLPEDVREALNIHMVSLRLTFGEREYIDKVSITPNQFYHELINNPHSPKTSQPPLGDFKRQFRFLAAHYDAVLSVNLSQLISGTYQAAHKAATELRNEGNFAVIDTNNAAAGLGLLAISAAEAAVAGLDLPTTQQYVSQLIPRTHTLAVVSDLTYAVRGGRVSALLKRIADLLHLTIVIGDREGRVTSRTIMWGRHNLPDRFARLICRRFRRNTPIRFNITHGINQRDAERVRELLLNYFTQVDACYLSETGATVGTHAGPESIVVGIQEYQPPPRLPEGSD